MPQLGEKVGESQTSEVYAWGDDSVAKLFKDAIPRAWIDYEAATAKAAADAGAPAPHMRGVIEIDGRPAIIYQRCEGKTLLESALAGDITPNETGAVMATLAHAIHAARSRPACPRFASGPGQCSIAWQAATSPPTSSTRRAQPSRRSQPTASSATATSTRATSS